MPFKTEWAPNELFLSHNGVGIFHTYKNDEDEVLTYHFGTSSDTSVEDDDTFFDVRDLPTWKQPEHPPYILSSMTFQEAELLNAAWKKYFDDNIEENAIREAILAAIDGGDLAVYILAAEYRPKYAPGDSSNDSKAVESRGDDNNLAGATPGEWEMDTTSENAISIWANSERDNGLLLATVHLEAGHAQAHANAKLMANSKKMATALINCRNAMSDSGLWSADEPFMENIDRVLDKVLFE